MIVELKGYGLYLGVLTVRGVYVEDPELLIGKIREDFGGLNIQVLDAKNVAGFKHILISVLTALEAFNCKLNIAKSLSMEILVRASTQRQINEALDILGIKRGLCDVVFIAVCEERDRVEEVLNNLMERYCNHVDMHLLEEDRSDRIMKMYGISEETVESEVDYSKGKWEAVKNLIAEKVALTLTL
ncbi:MAG: KEOPS complex subunit Cgi121 [Candidatus Bathyarchaeia archaeon]